MLSLGYKTRASASPQGKQQVLFISHPADAPVYFDKIAEDILKQCDAAVWYEQEGGAPATDEVLARMRLVVFPITARFLSEPSEARDRLLPFAVSHRLPLLPLMMEEGIVALFNRTCGELQFLSVAEEDPTALPYEEKFSRRLSETLLGDAEVSAVRAAFSAYIFLSYRKKDRAEAQRMMRLIHAHAGYRDIAIWYDEFLTPGEDFNLAIRKALTDSSLFVMVVTPNLVNETNYVMTEEYPMARREGKHVLPLLALPTDEAQLRAHYEGVPRPVDTENGEALLTALSDVLAAIGLDGALCDAPEHLYRIGLAYLQGIDVEVDTARGVSLLNAAAEAGYVSAIERLITLYERGEGVERDLDMALSWRRRLADRYEALLAETGEDAMAYCHYVRALAALSTAERAASLFKETLLTIDRMAGAVKQAAAAGVSLSSDDRARVAEHIRDLFVDMGIMDEAQKQAAEAVGLRAEERESHPPSRGLWFARDMLGHIALLRDDMQTAEESFADALAIAKERHAAAPTAVTRRDLAHSVRRTAELSTARGRYGEAEAALKAAHEDMTLAYEEERSVEAKASLLRLEVAMGVLAKARGDRRREALCYRDAVRRAVEVADALGTPSAVREAALVYGKLGDVAVAEGSKDTALLFYGKSMEMLQGVYTSSLNAVARAELAALYRQVAMLMHATGKSEAALNGLKHALETDQSLRRQRKLWEDRLHVAEDFCLLGDVFWDKDEKEKAEKAYIAAEGEASSAVRLHPSSIALHERYGDILLWMARAAAARGDKEATQKRLAQNEEICDALFRLLPSRKNHMRLVDAYRLCAEVLPYEAARSHYQAAMELCRMLGSSEAMERLAHITAAQQKAEAAAREREGLEATEAFLRALTVAAEEAEDAPRADGDKQKKNDVINKRPR